MADKKISALTASTTPLAGTEVLPIVQSGATVKVAVSDLTAGRTVAASSLTLTTPLSVANGGIGAATLTAGYLTKGNGASAVSASIVYDTGQYIGVGTATPIVSAGRNITVSSLESSISLVTTGNRTYSLASGGNFEYLGDALCFIDNTAAATRMVIDSSGNVGIGGNPAATALLDVQSTTKGVRFPNMTTTQKNAITPAAGTVIFDTTLAKLCVYSGAAWQTITSI